MKTIIQFLFLHSGAPTSLFSLSITMKIPTEIVLNIQQSLYLSDFIFENFRSPVLTSIILFYSFTRRRIFTFHQVGFPPPSEDTLPSVCKSPLRNLFPVLKHINALVWKIRQTSDTTILLSPILVTPSSQTFGTYPAFEITPRWEIRHILSLVHSPMFNIFDFLPMSSHELLLAGDTPDPSKCLVFYKNVKAALREKLILKDKNSHTISSLKSYSCIYPKIYNFCRKAN